MLRRFLLIFLAVLLPLQFSWGAVSGYCEHESGARAKHFAHHEHVHKAETKKVADLKVAPDNDCGTCHGAGVTALVGPQAALPALVRGNLPNAAVTRAPPSLPPDGPYRPQWPRLA
jgi:hypothetical protein